MMEELNILEAFVAERKIQFLAVVEFFCIFLSVLLLSDPRVTRSAEDFFDLLLVPVAESGNAAYGRSTGNMPDMEKTVKSALKKSDFRNPVVPRPDGTRLLTEVATAGQGLMLEDIFDPNDGSMADSENFPILAMADKISMPEPGTDSSEITVSAPKLQDPIVSGLPSDMEIQIDPDSPSDLEMQADPDHPSGSEMRWDSQPLSDIQEDTKITAADVIQDPIPDPVAGSTIQEPDAQEPLPDGPQIPNETVEGSVTSEESPDLPSMSELTEPDPAASDVTGPSDMEAAPEEGNTTETTSCFLIDESGMLFGFLPEYAEIQDGCLMLPAGCTGIRSGTFSGTGAGITELYIPAGVTLIEDGSLADLDSLVYIDVESPNPVYTSINGILFDSTATVLLSFPAGRFDVYSIPSHVMQIANKAFANTSLSRLDLRRCPSLLLGDDIFGPSAGNGIIIAVPAESFQIYEDMLSAYAVTLTV